jgi:hypothetical protein
MNGGSAALDFKAFGGEQIASVTPNPAQVGSTLREWTSASQDAPQVHEWPYEGWIQLN